MDLFKKLREDSLKRVLPLALLLLAAGAALYFLFSCYDLLKLMYPRTLAELTPESMSGVWLEDDITYFHMVYAQEMTYQDGRPSRVTGAQYVIRFDDEHYMGLFAHRDSLEEARAMLAACDSYYSGELDEANIPSMHVRGVIQPMDEATLRYYLNAARGDKDVESIMLPFYVDVNHLNGRPLLVSWIVLGVSLALILAGVILGIFALVGGHQRRVKAKVVASIGEPSASVDRIQRFYEETVPVGGVRVRSDFIMLQKGAGSILLRPWDVTWAYQTARHGLVGGKPYAVVFRTADNLKYSVPMSEYDAHDVLELLETHCPGIVLGYSKDKERSYKGDPTFANRWEAVRSGGNMWR